MQSKTASKTATAEVIRAANGVISKAGSHGANNGTTTAIPRRPNAGRGNLKKEDHKDHATPQPTGRVKMPSIDKMTLLQQRSPQTVAVIIDHPAEGSSLVTVMKNVSRSINLVIFGVKV